MAEIDEWLTDLPENVQGGVRRLVELPIYASLDTAQFNRIVADFWRIHEWDQWDALSRPARDAWSGKFEKLIDELTAHIEKGPLPPARWGFPVKDVMLMDLLRCVGVPIPDAADTQAYWKEVTRLSWETGKCDWTLADLLAYYRQSVMRALYRSPGQMLKKPGDPKAKRAFFILLLQGIPGLTVSGVADIASAMLEDEAIDERLVRRISSACADSLES